MTETRRLRIEGVVQGVGYRAWAAETARALGLAGWVRNRRDGSVEIIVAGDSDALERLVAIYREGPPAARVDRIAVEASEDQAPAWFEVRPTA